MCNVTWAVLNCPRIWWTSETGFCVRANPVWQSKSRMLRFVHEHHWRCQLGRGSCTTLQHLICLGGHLRLLYFFHLFCFLTEWGNLCKSLGHKVTQVMLSCWDPLEFVILHSCIVALLEHWSEVGVVRHVISSPSLDSPGCPQCCYGAARSMRCTKSAHFIAYRRR